MNLENLFSPIMVGRSEVKNRIVMAPMGANFEAVDGSVTEALIDYFEERARGEVGLIISSGLFPCLDGVLNIRF